MHIRRLSKPWSAIKWDALGKITVGVLIVVLFIGFAVGKDLIHINRQADSAIFEQVVHNIYLGKGTVSQVFSATQNFIDKIYFGLSFDELLNTTLSPPDTPERDIMRFHAYWILYLLAPLQVFVSASLLLALTQVLSCAGLLFLVYCTSREYGRGILVSALGAAIVLTSPVFIGILLGQFYPDRLFVVLGFLFAYLIYFRKSMGAVMVTALLLIMLNERAALIGGFLAILLPMCRRGEGFPLRTYVPYWSIGMVMLGYAAFITQFWIINMYYSGGYLPNGLENLIHRFSTPTFFANAVIFVLVCLVMLLMSLGNYRLTLVALFLMAPNLVGSIGGAEKTGWVTHYHSYYFPMLVFAAIAGFNELKLRKESFQRLAMLATAFAGMIFVVHNEISSGRLPPVPVITVAYKVLLDNAKGLPTGYAIRDAARATIPDGSTVVTNELGIALLSERANVNLFPVAIDSADYLFIACDLVRPGADASVKPAIPAQWLIDRGFDPNPIAEVSAVGQCTFQRRK